jgi:hypothetical protein
MNDQPIEQAQDEDLRQSRVAMMRAAERARELAERTGTELVVARGREVAYLKPEAAGPQQGSADAPGTAATDDGARQNEASRE